MSSVPYGARKLLDLCRALLSEPRLLLLDEPTSGTSSSDRRAIADFVLELRTMGITTVVVDHDIGFLAPVCDRLLAMNFGRSLGVGAPKYVLALPEVINSYIGLEN